MENKEVEAFKCGVDIMATEFRHVVEMLIDENHKLTQMIDAASRLMNDNFERHVDNWGNMTICVPSGWMFYLKEALDHATQ